MALVQARRWTDMLPYDQLRGQMADGRVFHGLVEGPIGFPPTYKFEKVGCCSAGWAQLPLCCTAVALRALWPWRGPLGGRLLQAWHLAHSRHHGMRRAAAGRAGLGCLAALPHDRTEQLVLAALLLLRACGGRVAL